MRSEFKARSRDSLARARSQSENAGLIPVARTVIARSPRKQGRGTGRRENATQPPTDRSDGQGERRQGKRRAGTHPPEKQGGGDARKRSGGSLERGKMRRAHPRAARRGYPEVSGTLGVCRDPRHRSIETRACHRPKEGSIPEGKHASVGCCGPIADGVRICGNRHHRSVQ